MLRSDWYLERLRVKQERDIALWRRHVSALESFRSRRQSGADIDVAERLSAARRELQRVCSLGYIEELVGTIGADPFPAAAGPKRENGAAVGPIRTENQGSGRRGPHASAPRSSAS